MDLSSIVIFSAAALMAGWLLKKRGRKWFLLVGSLLAIYWLQPALPIRNLDFWLPTASIALTILVYTLTLPTEKSFGRENGVTAMVIAAIIISIGASRYIAPLCCLTPTRPPQLPQLLIAVAIISLLVWTVFRISRKQLRLFGLSTVVLLGLFIILKNEALAQTASGWLRGMTGQSQDLANAADIRWLGFSYVAFRLMHTLRDRISNRLPDLTLNEFVTYIIFFPAITAGPIDRVQRFIGDLRADFELAAPQLLDGGQRIFSGIFKKFVLADSLALISLNSQNAVQSDAMLWTWVMLFAYSFRIYFDFSGYTDIAIGIGRLLGITLPENFNRPYLQQNITSFWNSWHITLAQWFRAYYFNPLTRAMRTSKVSLPIPMIIFIGQVSTMALIGLWHGITWNFVIWGAWHGVGLFVHNRWAGFAKTRYSFENRSPAIQKLAAGVGIFSTFLFVAIGWIWFVLPDPDQAWAVIKILFRISM